MPACACSGRATVRVVPGDEHGRVQAASEPTDVDVSDRAAVRKALHEAFFSALEAQAGSRRRHAVLLGGFDSALVAAGLRRLGHDVDCYTFGFGDPTYEQRNAELMASSIGAHAPMGPASHPMWSAGCSAGSTS